MFKLGPVCISGYDWEADGTGSGKTPALSKAMKGVDPRVGSEQLIPTAIHAEMAALDVFGGEVERGCLVAWLTVREVRIPELLVVMSQWTWC